MGVGVGWLSGLGMQVFEASAVAVLVAGVLDVGWVGGSLDRAGSAVCLVWLVLFEGVFFLGAVWAWGLVVDLGSVEGCSCSPGTSLGLLGHAGQVAGCDASDGLGLPRAGLVRAELGVGDVGLLGAGPLVISVGADVGSSGTAGLGLGGREGVGVGSGARIAAGLAVGLAGSAGDQVCFGLLHAVQSVGVAGCQGQGGEAGGVLESGAGLCCGVHAAGCDVAFLGMRVHEVDTVCSCLVPSGAFHVCLGLCV